MPQQFPFNRLGTTMPANIRASLSMRSTSQLVINCRIESKARIRLNQIRQFNRTNKIDEFNRVEFSFVINRRIESKA